MGLAQTRLHWDFNNVALLLLEQMVAVEDSTNDLILACEGEINLKRINLKQLDRPSSPGPLSVTHSLSPLMLF